MSFYTDIRDDDVIPMIQEFGQTITMERTANTTNWEKRYNASTGAFYWYNTSTAETSAVAPTGAVTEYSGYGVVVNYEDSVIDDTLIKRGDKKILTIELPSPLIGDKYTIGSTVYSYVDHITVSPANTDVLYKIQVRI